MPDAPTTQHAVEVFQRAAAAINAHEIDALAALLSPDHLFVDSLGNRVTGASSMHDAWAAYFAMCPDYHIHIDTLVSQGDIVLASGEAGGTIDGSTWRIPAAWQVTVANGLLAEWRVFADNKPVYEILARRR
ncbi:MAG TPA: nuclear transport factor 2 family protein [Bryobacteraceae bacterium]|jgi:ketosteroid isomerase-like protein|nr:nuclear transport factor 2 family protein [Bryobacteraceae bacterium]